MPKSLSPSQAKTFKQCPLQWWFGSVARWRTPPSRHTLLGNVVHASLEEFYKAPAEERTRGHALALLEDAWIAAKGEPENEIILADADEIVALGDESRNAVEGLWELEVPHEIDVSTGGIEIWVEAQIKDAPVGGRIDRYTDDGVLRISDYKTGRVPEPKYLEDALFGMWTYAAVMATNHPERRLPDEVELLYVGKGVRIRRPVLRDYLLGHARMLNAIWADATAMTNTESVLARRKRLCDWCNYRTACPLYSGRSTPMPGTPESDEILRAAGNVQSRRSTPAKDEFLDEVTDAEAAEMDADGGEFS